MTARCTEGELLQAHRSPRQQSLPDLIITTKLKRFEYQKEFHLAYTSTDAFAFENCDFKLVDRAARPLPKPKEYHRHIFDLGDLRSICRVHEVPAPQR